MAAQPQAFTLEVPDQAIVDLRERLGRTRFPDQAPGEPWAYGNDLSYLQHFVEYWPPSTFVQHSLRQAAPR